MGDITINRTCIAHTEGEISGILSKYVFCAHKLFSHAVTIVVKHYDCMCLCIPCICPTAPVYQGDQVARRRVGTRFIFVRGSR